MQSITVSFQPNRADGQQNTNSERVRLMSMCQTKKQKQLQMLLKTLLQERC